MAKQPILLLVLIISVSLFGSPNLFHDFDEHLEDLEDQTNHWENLESNHIEEVDLVPDHSWDQIYSEWEQKQVEWDLALESSQEAWEETMNQISYVSDQIRARILQEIESLRTYLVDENLPSIASGLQSFLTRAEELLQTNSSLIPLSQSILDYLEEQANSFAEQRDNFDSQIYSSSESKETIPNSDELYNSNFLTQLRSFIQNPNNVTSHALIQELNLRIPGLGNGKAVYSLQGSELKANTPTSMLTHSWNQDWVNPFSRVGGSFRELGDSFRTYTRNDWLIWGNFAIPVQTVIAETELQTDLKFTIKDSNAESNKNLYEHYRITLENSLPQVGSDFQFRIQNWERQKSEAQNQAEAWRKEKDEVQTELRNFFTSERERLDTQKENGLPFSSQETEVQLSNNLTNRLQSLITTSPTELSSFRNSSQLVLESFQSIWNANERILAIQSMESRAQKQEEQAMEEFLQSLKKAREWKENVSQEILKKFQEGGDCANPNASQKSTCEDLFQKNSQEKYESVEVNQGKIRVKKWILDGSSHLKGSDELSYDSYKAGKKLSEFVIELPTGIKRSKVLGTDENFFSTNSSNSISSAWRQFQSETENYWNQTFAHLQSQAMQNQEIRLQELNQQGQLHFERNTENQIKFKSLLKQLVEHLYAGGTFKAFLKNTFEETVKENFANELARAPGMDSETARNIAEALSDIRAKRIAKRKMKERQKAQVAVAVGTTALSFIPGGAILVPAVTAISATSIELDRKLTGGRLTKNLRQGLHEFNDHLSGKDLQGDLARGNFKAQVQGKIQNEIIKKISEDIEEQSGLSKDLVKQLAGGLLDKKAKKKEKRNQQIQNSIQGLQVALSLAGPIASFADDFLGATQVMSQSLNAANSVKGTWSAFQAVANGSANFSQIARVGQVALHTASGSFQGGTIGAMANLASSIALPLHERVSLNADLRWDPEKKKMSAGGSLQLAGTQGLGVGVTESGGLVLEKDIITANGNIQHIQIQTGNQFSYNMSQGLGYGTSVSTSVNSNGITAQGEFANPLNIQSAGDSFVGLSINASGTLETSIGWEDVELFRGVGTLANPCLSSWKLADDIAIQIAKIEQNRFDNTKFDVWQKIDDPNSSETSNNIPETALSILGSVAALGMGLRRKGKENNETSKTTNNETSKTINNESQDHYKHYNQAQWNGLDNSVLIKEYQSLPFADVKDGNWIIDKNSKPIVLTVNEKLASFVPKENLEKSYGEWKKHCEVLTKSNIENWSSQMQDSTNLNLGFEQKKLIESLLKKDKEISIYLELLRSQSQDSFSEMGNLANDFNSLSVSKPEFERKEIEKLILEKSRQVEEIKIKIEKNANLIKQKNSEFMNQIQKEKLIFAMAETKDDKFLSDLLTPQDKEEIKKFNILQKEIVTIKNEIETLAVIKNSNDKTYDRQKHLDLEKKLNSSLISFAKLKQNILGRAKQLEMILKINPSAEADLFQNAVLSYNKKTEHYSLIPGQTREIQLEVYTNKVTGEIARKSSLGRSDFILEARKFNQSESNPEADIIREMIGSTASSKDLAQNWCLAFSFWVVCKEDIGDSHVPDFKTYLQQMANNKLINTQTMRLETGSAVDYYANAWNKKMERTPIQNPKKIVDRVVIPTEFINDRPKAVQLRLAKEGQLDSGSHSVSAVLSSDGRTYTIIDSNNKKVNGTPFDPENPSASVLFDPNESPYKDYYLINTAYLVQKT